MPRIVSLASITSLFRPIPECPWIFECPKNATFDNIVNIRDLFYIVYPNNPKKYDEITHGQSTSIFVFQKVDNIEPISDKKELQKFIYDLRKEARTNKDFFAKTVVSSISLIDHDPRIEYEMPPESPLNNFKDLSDEIILMTKLPPEIDDSIAERLAILSDNIIYFGHITGLYIFATITGPGKFEVRRYTSDDNERYETMFAYTEVDNNQVVANVELDREESVMINKKMIISNPNFAAFIRNMFDFDSRKYIQMARSTGIGARKTVNTEEENSDDEVIDFLGMPTNPMHSRSILNDMLDMYGNPTMF